MKAIVVDHIEKSYAIKKTKVPALKGISFDVPQGELFGLIGRRLVRKKLIEL